MNMVGLLSLTLLLTRTCLVCPAIGACLLGNHTNYTAFLAGHAAGGKYACICGTRLVNGRDTVKGEARFGPAHVEAENIE